MSTIENMDDPAAEAAPGETHWTVQEQPQASIVPLAMEGEPATDKAFETKDGTKFRARIVRIAEQNSAVPTNGDVRVAPSGINLSLTLAALDDNMEVRADSTGALLITDVHQIVFTDAAYRNPDFDPVADVDRIIREQAFVLETRISKRAAVAELLNEWGGAPFADPLSLAPPPDYSPPAGPPDVRSPSEESAS